MKFKQIVCSVALVFSFGVSAFTIKDMQNPTKKEIAELTQQAEQGDATALSILADFYMKGSGVQSDPMKGFELLKKAAELGDERSQYLVLNFYAEGVEHTPQEISMALRWLVNLANNNTVQAQVLLSKYYIKGLGVDQDFTKAAEWMEKAANQGDTQALRMILGMYEEELGVEQNYPKSKKWLEQLAVLNDAEAQFTLGHFYEEGLGVRQDIAKAIEWYEKSVENGSIDGIHQLARIHIKDENFSKAKIFLDLGAQQDDAISQYFLGQFYENGAGVRQDLTEAKEWYGISCDNGSQEGCDEYKRLNK